MVRPLSLAEFTDVTVQTVLERDSCEEFKIHFVRPKDRPQEWSGLVSGPTVHWCIALCAVIVSQCICLSVYVCLRCS